MALKMLTKAETPKKLPKGADRFLWTEFDVERPPSKKKPNYSAMLKGKPTRG